MTEQATTSLTAERMSPQDALFLHLENDETPMHTLKVLVLDTARRGAAITLPEVVDVVSRHLGLVPRAAQRLVAPGGLGARPFWVEDEALDISAHIDEVTLPIPDRAELDIVCARLAERHLDRSRPLWGLTLVHGLPEGRQAVVARVHHAVCDGIATVNILQAVTTSSPGVGMDAPVRPAITAPPPTPSELRRLVAREAAALVPGVADLSRSVLAGRRAVRDFGSRVDIPSSLPSRNSLNTPSGLDRICASATVDFALVRAVCRASGATVNGVLHGMVAGAVREELLARGENVTDPTVATFGVSGDVASPRLAGNDVVPTSTYLRSDIADLETRLRTTARSCLLAVDLRRRRGFDVARRAPAYAVRLMPLLRERLAHVSPVVANHVTTANVQGPREARWIGDIRVEEWISFAVAIAPADVNLTMYSYDGTLSLGLVTTPESMPEPQVFLARVLDQLRQMVELFESRPVSA